MHIGLEGYSEVEFRRTARGQPRLMEVNARLSQSWSSRSARASTSPAMQLEWARGGGIPRAAARAAARVGWLARRPAGDGRRARGLPAAAPARSAIRAVGGDYLLGRARIEGLALDDLRPIVGAVAFHLRNGVAHLRRNHG